MDLDDTDKAILYLLQKETRTSLTHDEIADRIDVSSSTVSNRLQRLKERGILVDYQPKIDYEAAGAPHHVLFVCTAPISQRTELANEAIEIPGVVDIRELLVGTQNLHVEVVCLDTTSVETVAEALDELGLTIDHSEILRREYARPFDHFGSELVGDSSDE
ncbi:Lrp/AsnC family transcriptional regulator [Halobacteria archaeon AArc-m2/3/4]|uniref:Lrp/AsnC family transcriptional regulator n=1 Tax=Natronoglomus mannanivorans TaxID=2979990 RepID=A0AAP2Z3E4_9EURY|nr:Lrp/AsnC family transcriptional regulator [Halobacteria archaeon AArc-xg1-1]MCU4972833.1 Lrp/AsnC family transcriptional regulator [Halobacteria archaeon AArc-m2/3/4]